LGGTPSGKKPDQAIAFYVERMRGVVTVTVDRRNFRAAI
jgi:hypothetical protein